MDKGGHVYILTNRPRGSLYIGVCADLPTRLWQHANGEGSKFAHKYNLDKLVFHEWHDGIADTIVREKQLKGWRRDWKIALIERDNPEWQDQKPILFA